MSNVIGFLIGIAAGGMMGALVMALIYDRWEEEELRRKNNANGTRTVSEKLETDSKGDKGKG